MDFDFIWNVLFWCGYYLKDFDFWFPVSQLSAQFQRITHLQDVECTNTALHPPPFLIAMNVDLSEIIV